MSDLVAFNSEAPLAVPDYLQTQNIQSNMDAGTSVPTLSIRGKAFRVVIDGNETVLQHRDEQLGEMVPLQSLQLVVLDQGPYGARVYYADKYDPESKAGPTCFSLDGKTPDAQAASPQAKTCAACPHSIKGSRMSLSGLPTTACVLQRRLAVVPINQPDFSALLLRLPPTSAFDKETKNSQSGWFAWKQYTDFLSARGVTHTAQVVTRVRFDPAAETPKLLFRPDRFLTKAEADVLLPRIQSEEVRRLLYPSADAVVVEDAQLLAAPSTPAEAVDAAPVAPANPGKQAAKPPRRTVAADADTQPAKSTKESLSDLLAAWGDE